MHLCLLCFVLFVLCFLYCSVYVHFILTCFVSTSVLPPGENAIAVNNNNNNNNNFRSDMGKIKIHNWNKLAMVTEA